MVERVFVAAWWITRADSLPLTEDMGLRLEVAIANIIDFHQSSSIDFLITSDIDATTNQS